MGTPTTSTITADPDIISSSEVRVLVVDGRQDRRQLMGHVVQQGGYNMTVVGYADDPASAVEAVERLGANAALIEIQLPVPQGLDTISALNLAYPDLRIIVCSFHQDAATKRAALDRGAEAYFVKPVSPRDLHTCLRSDRPSPTAGGPPP